MSTLIIVLNLLLGIICVIFIARNLMFHFKGSESGIKNMIYLGFLIVALFCALSGLCKGISIKKEIGQLGIAQNIDKWNVKYIEKNIEIAKKSLFRITILGYGCLLGAYLMFKNIGREISKNIGKPKKNGIWINTNNKK